MLNLNSIRSGITGITSKGASLLRKEKALNIAKAAEEGLIIPKDAVTYDAVRVGRNFNHAENYTDVFTFHDSNGNIIKRYIKKVDGKDIKETVRSYEDMASDEFETGGQFVGINTRKIRSQVRENGNLTSVSEDVFSVTDEVNPHVTHSKREVIRGNEKGAYRSTNYENIILEQRRHGEQPIFIKNKYEVDRYGNGSHQLLSSEVSSPELKPIAENTYLLPYVSPHSKFVHRMTHSCLDDANIIATPEIVVYKETSKTGGYFSRDGVVNINLKSSRDLSQPRVKLTETIAHEVEHAKWDERCTQLELQEIGLGDEFFDKVIAELGAKNIKRYQRSVNNYIPHEVNPRGYRNQYCEQVAFEGGKKGVRKYDNLEESLNKTFPFKHSFQFYPPKNNEDDLVGLLSLLRSF